MNLQLYLEWKALSGKAATDKFFENYEKDPHWLTPDGNPTADEIDADASFLEAQRQIGIINRLEKDILGNLRMTETVIRETMTDPSFEAMGYKLIEALNVGRKQMQDILDERKESIMILMYGRVPFRE